MSKSAIDRAVELCCPSPTVEELDGKILEAFSWKRDLSAVAVADLLLVEYSAEEATQTFEEQILKTGHQHWTNDPLSRRDFFKASVCFRIAADDDRVSVGTDVVEKAVRQYPAVGWYRSIGPLVRRRLNDKQLLQSLKRGLDEGATSQQQDCVLALSMYSHCVTCHCSLAEIEPDIDAVERAMSTVDILDVHVFDGARKALAAFRRGPREPEIDPENYELHGGSSPIFVEKATQKPVLEVKRYEARDRTLVVQYEPINRTYREDRARCLIREMLVKPETRLPTNRSLEWIRYSNMRGREEAVRRYPSP